MNLGFENKFVLFATELKICVHIIVFVQKGSDIPHMSTFTSIISQKITSETLFTKSVTKPVLKKAFRMLKANLLPWGLT